MTAFDRMIDLLPGAKDTSGDFRDGRAGAGGGNRHGLLLLRSLRLLEATPQPVTPPESIQRAGQSPSQAVRQTRSQGRGETDLAAEAAAARRPAVTHDRQADVAPKFYPVLSSFPGLGLLCWAGDAAGDGAELFALRSARARRGLKVEANSAGVCHPSCEWGREPL